MSYRVLHRVLEKEERGRTAPRGRAGPRQAAGSHFRRRGSARDASWHGNVHKLVN